MAPERFRHTELTSSADIYALACVLFESMTGSPPYAAADPIGLMDEHLNSPIPRPSEVRPGIPSAFDEVIACGMAKDPARRYSSAGYLALAAYHALAASDQDRPDTLMDGGEGAKPLADVRASIADAFVAAEEDTAAGATMVDGPGGGAGNTATSSPAPADAPEPTPAPGAEAIATPPRPTAWISSFRPHQESSTEPPRPQRLGRVSRIVLIAASVLITVTVASLVVFQSIRWSRPEPPPGTPVVVPFTGLNAPAGVAEDHADNLSVTDYLNNRVLKLAAGSSSQTAMPFPQLSMPDDVTVDSAGNVFVADYANDPVLKLPASKGN